MKQKLSMGASYELIYFNFRGRAELARLILALADVDYTDTRMTSPENWLQFKQGMVHHVHRDVIHCRVHSVACVSWWLLACWLSKKQGSQNFIISYSHLRIPERANVLGNRSPLQHATQARHSQK